VSGSATASPNISTTARWHAGRDGEIVEIDMAPLLEAAQLLYGGPWVAERTAAIALLRDNPDAIDPTVRASWRRGWPISAVDCSTASTVWPNSQRGGRGDVGRRSTCSLFRPRRTIYRVAELLAAPIALNSNLGLYTNFVNLLDMAASRSLPAQDQRHRLRHHADRPRRQRPRLLDHGGRLSGGRPPRLRPARYGGKNANRETGRRRRPSEGHAAALAADLARTRRFVGAFQDRPDLSLYAMANSLPPKPALVHSEDGAAIAVEVYELDVAAFGSFVAEVRLPWRSAR
jgi:allophanate hydrolase